MSKTATAPELGKKTLSEYITDRFDGFSRSQKEVARYIVDHLDEAAFQTAEELARRADTSSSTVVRFSQALGFTGYPELQQAAIEEYRRRGAGSNGASAPLFDFDQSEFEASLGADHANVEETARNLDRETIAECIEAIANARHIIVVGTEQMAFFASYLRHLLALLNLRVEIVTSQGQEAMSKLGRLEEHSLLISFSAGKAPSIVMRAMKLARSRGSRTIAISDATLSDVASLADLMLYYSSNSPSFTRSNAALLALVQALT